MVPPPNKEFPSTVHLRSTSSSISPRGDHISSEAEKTSRVDQVPPGGAVISEQGNLSSWGCVFPLLSVSNSMQVRMYAGHKLWVVRDLLLTLFLLSIFCATNDSRRYDCTLYFKPAVSCVMLPPSHFHLLSMNSLVSLKGSFRESSILFTT